MFWDKSKLIRSCSSHILLKTFDVYKNVFSHSVPLHSVQMCRSVACTCNKGVLDSESKAFQLLVAGELNPHKTSCGCDNLWILSPTEAINERRETKWPITYFDVIEATLKRWLYVVVLIKRQLNPLSRKGFGKQGSRERKETKGENLWKEYN